MGQAAEKLRMTPEEYLAFERASEERHEFVDSEIFAMSGGTWEHSLTTSNILMLLQNMSTEHDWEAHGGGLRFKSAAGNYHYADAFALCGEPVFEGDTRDIVLNPKAIFEVLSDSTERYDRGDKFASYRTIAALDDYVLVSQKSVLVEHFHRLPDGDWLYRALGPGETLSLASIGCEIPVDRLYWKVFPAAT